MSERGQESVPHNWLQTALIAVAVVVLVAVGAAVLDRVQGPSESECNTQRLEVMAGDRSAVEDACR